MEMSMPGLNPTVDPNGLLEYSVVYTDRSLNHMSQNFQNVMNDISTTLKKVYSAATVTVVPGSGTFGMEAVARQFASNKKCLIIRNGWFSFRWSQILDMGQISNAVTVLKAKRSTDDPQAPFAPPPIEDVVAPIRKEKPEIVFAPHVETSSGIILPDDYIKEVAQAVRQEGGLFVLDCIASGTMWVNMEKTNVDILISAPQKGWSGSPCCALVMMSPRAMEHLATSQSSSFACDLKKWRQIMEAYEKGGHAYHATMPTEGLRNFRDVMKETVAYGLDKIKNEQLTLGTRLREVLEAKGFPSVAADGFQAPGVIVSYTNDPEIKTGKKFLDHGIQIAAGVPLQCDEPQDFQTFRIGLFGLDKLGHVERTIKTFSDALDRINS